MEGFKTSLRLRGDVVGGVGGVGLQHRVREGAAQLCDDKTAHARIGRRRRLNFHAF